MSVGGYPSVDEYFDSHLSCSYNMEDNRFNFIKYESYYSWSLKFISERVDRLFETSSFMFDSGLPGLKKKPGFEESWETVGTWENLEKETDRSFTQFQYVFQDANMYVQVQMQFQDFPIDGDLREEAFEMALAAAETIREDSAYDFD